MGKGLEKWKGRRGKGLDGEFWVEMCELLGVSGCAGERGGLRLEKVIVRDFVKDVLLFKSVLHASLVIKL